MMANQKKRSQKEQQLQLNTLGKCILKIYIQKKVLTDGLRLNTQSDRTPKVGTCPRSPHTCLPAPVTRDAVGMNNTRDNQKGKVQQ